MTVSSEINKSGPYSCNGVTIAFDYEFRIRDESHISVVLTAPSNVESVLVLGENYSVSNVGDANGGQIITNVTYGSGYKITIVRRVPFVQETDLENQGAYYADTVEGAFDLAAMRDQQLSERIDRSLKIPVSADPSRLDGVIGDVIRMAASADNIDAVANIGPQVVTVAGIDDEIVTISGIHDEITTVADIASDVAVVADVAADIPTVAANVVDITNFADVYLGAKDTTPSVRNNGTTLQPGDLYFSTTEDLMKVRTSAAEWADASALSLNMASNSFVGNAVQTTFALSTTPGLAANALVWVGGVRQKPIVDYTVSGTTLTMTVAPGNGVGVDTVVIATTSELRLPADGSVSPASLNDNLAGRLNFAFDNVAEIDAATIERVATTLTARFFDGSKTPGSGVEFTHSGTANPGAPGQVDVSVAGVPHFYTRSSKVLRPQQHGVKTGGAAAANRAGLIEMLNLANYTGHEIDMGDANDVYEIAAGITHTFTKKLTIRGSGATIKLNKAGGAVSQYAFRLLHNQLGFDLEGFSVDANNDAPYVFSIENTYAGALDEATIKDGRLVGVGAHRGYTRTNLEMGTRGINVTGWLRNLILEDTAVDEVRIAAGAYNINYSTAAYFVGRNVAGAYPLFKDFKNIYFGKVASEDYAQTSNMDGIMIYDAIPENGLSRPIGATSIRGGIGREFWGRGIKAQALNVDVHGMHFDLTTAPTGNQITALIDFQFGGGKVVGGSLRCIGKSPKNIFIGQSQTYSAGQTVIHGFEYWASVGTPEPDSYAWYIPDTSPGTRSDGGIVVRDSHTRVGSVRHILRASTAVAGAYTERVYAENNSISVSNAGILFEFRESEQMAAKFSGNFNLSTSLVPAYKRQRVGTGTPVGNAVSVYGGDNWYFSVGT